MEYMAPEILKRKAYNATVDWWLFGVTICEMATGMSPFNNSDTKELINSIKFCDPEIPDWLDEDLKHLLGQPVPR
ncbi:protein kinase C theta type-like [Xenopus laevis]|uniref:Protein kinase C theta type-like n=1 Tax=Xenopus laevis TaxID=8355 RepID=A0A8J1LE33_XENLA|nr:protein kinase C theta type-like [Xenopus laevis]